MHHGRFWFVLVVCAVWKNGVAAAQPVVPIAPPEASKVTFERLSRWPEPGWQVPRAIAFSPDSKLVTFLQGRPGSDEMSLYGYDLTTGQTRVLLAAGDLAKTDGPMSREEELRRERQRQRTRGISDYVRTRSAPLLVVPFGGDVYVRQGDGAVARLTRTPEPELDPKPCDTGARVAFVRGGELYMVDVASRRETRLTHGARPGVSNGQSDFNGQEELREPSGFFWSPRCDRIVFLEVDERQVAELPVVGYRDGEADVMHQRYPRPGKPNPKVRIGVVDVLSRKTTFLRPFPGSSAEHYFGRFAWAPDGQTLYLQSLTRDQKRRELLAWGSATGAIATLAVEEGPAWVEFSDVRVLKRTPGIVWTRNREGYHHLELLDPTGKASPRWLTQGAWDVTDVNGLDEASRRVVFTATREDPRQRQLYSASLDEPGEPQRHTTARGVHSVTIDDGGQLMVDVHSSSETPPAVAIADLRGGALGTLPVPLDDDFAALGLRPVEPVTVKGPSGDLLYGQILKPRNLQPGRRYPAVVMVYGGPHAQAVQDRWSARLSWQHLADRGVVVFQLDNRGTPGRGRDFETAIHGKLADVPLADQLAGLDYLASLPFVDGKRIGIYGHSYGGYMTVLALLRAPSRFRVGVAGSPVSDWSLYDSGYTERYLGTPAQHPDWYAAASTLPLVSQLASKLLIVHSLMDENVHFSGTAKLIDALAAAGKPFDLMLFPGERHGYRAAAAKRYSWQRVLEYLTQNL